MLVTVARWVPRVQLNVGVLCFEVFLGFVNSQALGDYQALAGAIATSVAISADAISRARGIEGPENGTD